MTAQLNKKRKHDEYSHVQFTFYRLVPISLFTDKREAEDNFLEVQVMYEFFMQGKKD